jgi:hypothetical protein
VAKTIQNILDEARDHIQDTEATTQRYSDDELLSYLNNGITEIRRLRPDLFVGTFDAALPRFTSADLASNWPLEDITDTAISYFVAGNAALRDDENVLEGRASGLMTLFAQKLMVAGI